MGEFTQFNQNGGSTKKVLTTRIGSKMGGEATPNPTKMVFLHQSGSTTTATKRKASKWAAHQNGLDPPPPFLPSQPPEKSEASEASEAPKRRSLVGEASRWPLGPRGPAVGPHEAQGRRLEPHAALSWRGPPFFLLLFLPLLYFCPSSFCLMLDGTRPSGGLSPGNRKEPSFWGSSLFSW